jgi:regulator of protease activity HflC (stomatin/prohibitin superfamily)
MIESRGQSLWIPVYIVVMVLVCAAQALVPMPLSARVAFVLAAAFALAALSVRIVAATSAAIVLRFNKRTKAVRGEGICFIIPFVESLLRVNCKRKTETIETDRVFTPKDKAEISVTTEVTYQPQDLVLFVEVENLIEQLGGMIAEAVREFAADPNATPQTWEDAQGMAEKFGRMIVAKLSGQAIPRYKNGKPKPERGMTDKEKEYKQITVESYNRLSRGEGDFSIPGLGIILRRLNVTKVEPSDELKKALEKISKENQEQVAQSKEAETVALRLITFLRKFGVSDEVLADPQKLQEVLGKLDLSLRDLLADFRAETSKGTENILTIRGVERVLGMISGMTKGGG